MVVNFKTYLDEASIVKGKYDAGHKLELSRRAPPHFVKALGKDIELADATDDMIEVGTGTESIIVKSGGKVYKVNGTKSGINGAFNHKSGGGGKADTHKATRVKEAISLLMFKNYQENGSPIKEEDAIELLPSLNAEADLYIEKFYDSALLQLSSYKKLKLIRGKTLTFEFQGDKYSKKIYDKAKALGAPASADNWNPADLWIFETSFTSSITSELSDIETLNELNFWIRKSYLMGKVAPISLKQAKGKSTMELVNPIKYKNKKLTYDFNLNRITIAGSLKSVFIETNSGFTFKANSRGAASNPTLYLEGTMKQENFAMGAIDAKLWQKYHGGKVLNGTTIKPTTALLNSSKKIFNKYKSNITKKNNDILWNPDFKKFDNTLQQRYIAAASLLDFVMSDYNDVMRWGFFTAMKVTDTNSMYVKIK